MTSVLSYFSHVPQFVFTWSIFFSAAILFFTFQIIKTKQDFSAKELLSYCIPFNPLTSKSFHMDAKIYVIRKLTDFIFVIPGHLIFAAVSSGIYGYLHFAHGEIPPAGVDYSITIVYIVVILLISEFSYFLSHYLQHKIPILWELHKVHHSADLLTPLTNMRVHPLGGVLFKTAVNGVISGVPVGIFMYYFGFSLPEIIVINAVSMQLLTVCTLDPLRHSHLPMGYGPLDKLIISPLMHQAHHSSAEIHWDKNFGTNLSIFDWMLGTAYRPKKGEKFKFGIYGCSDVELQEFNTLWGAYISPVERILRALVKPGFSKVEPIKSE